jgi:hypothetical protein
MQLPLASPLPPFSGGVLPTATTLSAIFLPSTGCGTQIYFGTLTRQ